MMRNKEVLNEIRKQSRTLIEEKRDKFVKQSLLSDEFIDMMQRNRKPFDLLSSVPVMPNLPSVRSRSTGS